jgi:hypothetical protein
MKPALQLGYDADQDRLLITLTSVLGQQRFWLTRRQCIALVVALGRAQGEEAPLKFAPAASAGLASQLCTSVQREVEGSVPEEPPALCRLSLRETAQGLRLGLRPAVKEAGASRSLVLQAREQVLLRKTLRHLAMRAQWDLDAAEARAAANAALKKAQRLH